MLGGSGGGTFSEGNKRMIFTLIDNGNFFRLKELLNQLKNEPQPENGGNGSKQAYITQIYNTEGKTALYKAVQAGSIPIMLLLADFVLTDTRIGDLKQRQGVLKEWINRQLPDEDGFTALHEAAGGENYRILQFLLAQGGDVNVVDYKGQTLLHEATKWCQPINASILYKLGIPIDAQDENKMTPLHQCSARS